MKDNAINRRLKRLSNQWQAFTCDPEARILCWLLAPDELQMFDAWVELQSDEQTADDSSVFVTLQTPFGEPQAHGFALGQTLQLGMQDGAAELRELGLKDGFALPTLIPDERDVAYCVRSSNVFRTYYDLRSPLVLVLRPSSVRDRSAYQLWLQSLALVLPAQLRVIVMDDAQQPTLLQLCAAENKRVRSVTASLDMPRAMQELSDAAGRLDTPGGQFRDLFVKLGNALGKQDLAGALALGTSALAITRAQGLWHLSVPVHFALASGLLAHARGPEAIEHYVAAEAAAQEGATRGAEELRNSCAQLVVQARLGRGAALLGSEDYAQASALYAETAELARASGDWRNALDGYRLASFCSEQREEYVHAWQFGLLGIEAARAMDAATLETSSVAYLGESMLRLTAHAPNAPSADDVTRQFAELIGTPKWRPGAAAEPGV